MRRLASKRGASCAASGEPSSQQDAHVTTTSSKGPKVPYRCSFCGKSQEQVRKLIAGQGVYICDECINLCQEIIEEEMLEAPRVEADEPRSCRTRPRSRRRSTST